MNQSELDNSILIKEIFLTIVGSTWLHDSLYICLIVPMGAIGVVLNILTICIFFKKEFKKIKFYAYLKTYSFISLILAGTMSCAFFISPRYLFDLSISHSAKIYKCLILPVYVLPFFLFCGHVMSILLNLERISNFNSNFNLFKRLSPYLISFCLLLVCFIINSPTYFLSNPNIDLEVNNALLSYQNVIKFKGLCLRPLNALNLTLWGKLITLLGIIIKDFLTFLFDIGSNIALVVYFRNYIKKLKELAYAQKNQLSSPPTQIKIKNKQINQLRKTYMTLYLNFFSAFIHLIILFADIVIYFFSEDKQMLFAFIFLTFFVVSLKQIMNFVIIFLFNSRFRESLKNTLRSIIQ